jgi:P27 family predicted phage terminase small subunit
MTAEERAQLLADLPEGEVPAFLTDGGNFQLELQIWKDLSSDLRRINALARLDRFGFAMYCVHMADWITATKEIRLRGATYKARNTVNGDVLQKLSPWVKVREIAERHILELAARFGLDPTSRYKLVGIQAGLVGQGFLPGMDQPHQAPGQSDGPTATALAPTGFLANNASPPPRPN